MGYFFRRLFPTGRRFYPVIKKCLPKAPVPDLDKTLDRFLEYASVVAAGQGRPMHDMHKAVESFRREGVPLQRKLQEFAAKSTNWVNDFWLPEMYLRIRLPLPINSSPAYVFPQQQFASDEDMIKYTALLIRAICDFQDKIDKRLIERELSTGVEKQPMCMEQYERILGCYRHPRRGADEQATRKGKDTPLNEHIAVLANRQVFAVQTRVAGELLPVSEVISQLGDALRISRNRLANTVIPVGAASLGDRDGAADVWEELLHVEENARSLEWMRSALFVVCLDSPSSTHHSLPVSGNAKEVDLVTRAHHILTGYGSQRYGLNRWYDASIQLIVSSDGTSGICIEHSAAEGIVIIHMVESALRAVRDNWNKRIYNSSDRGLRAKPLTWVLSERAKDLLQSQISTFDELASELDLQVLVFDEFGKDSIKKWRVSPDGFVQLALQLAHFRLHGYLVSTYESASLRRFAEGRVDNIRANSQEALEWVTASSTPQIPREKLVQLFRQAAAKQALITTENITGYGIDNHLCALQRISHEEGAGHQPAFFTHELWDELMRFPLSTSQVTTSPEFSDCLLCYGAVVRDGYGCSYNIQSNYMIFAPSAFRSNPRSDVLAFKDSIRESLRYMKQMLE